MRVIPEYACGMLGRGVRKEGGKVAKRGEGGWMDKDCEWKSQGWKRRVENDLTRSSLWFVLIFRALPSKRSNALQRCSAAYTHFLAPPPPLPPLPLSSRGDQRARLLASARRSSAHRCVSITATIMFCAQES